MNELWPLVVGVAIGLAVIEVVLLVAYRSLDTRVSKLESPHRARARIQLQRPAGKR